MYTDYILFNLKPRPQVAEHSDQPLHSVVPHISSGIQSTGALE